MFPHQVRSSSAHSATAEEVRQRRDLTTSLHQPPVQPAQPPEPEPEPSAPPSHEAALSCPTATPHFQSPACSERPGVYSHPDTSAAYPPQPSAPSLDNDNEDHPSAMPQPLAFSLGVDYQGHPPTTVLPSPVQAHAAVHLLAPSGGV